MERPASTEQTLKQIDAWRHVFESQREHVGRLQQNRIIPDSYIEAEMRRMRQLYSRIKTLERQYYTLVGRA